MPNKPKNTIQTPTEMLATAQERRLNSRIYNRTADNGEVVSAIVQQLAEDLVDIPQKADLKDTEQIRQIVISYVAMCARAGVIPSKIGLARACGYNRRTLEYFCDRHPEHPTAELLEIAFDAFAEAMSTAALSGSVQQVFAIFLSKALYKWEDTVTIKTTPADPMDYRTSAQEILAKYSREDLERLPD